jgi:hypothetical protein
VSFETPAFPLEVLHPYRLHARPLLGALAVVVLVLLIATGLGLWVHSPPTARSRDALTLIVIRDAS